MNNIKQDTFGRVLIESNKPFGKHGYKSNWLKVNGVKNQWIRFNGEKVYLADIQQLEDYTYKVNLEGDTETTSQFRIEQ